MSEQQPDPQPTPEPVPVAVPVVVPEPAPAVDADALAEVVERADITPEGQSAQRPTSSQQDNEPDNEQRQQ